MAQKSWRYTNKEKTIITGFDRILLDEFHFLENHRQLSEKSINETIKSFKERVNENVKHMEHDQRDLYQDNIYDEYIRTNEILPRIQWYSQYLIVYSTFEHILNELCKIVQRRSSFNLSFKDINGSGIERSKNYLTKVAGVKNPFQEPSWERAKLLSKIRNKITHNNGEIVLTPNNNKDLGTQLAKEKYLELNKIIPEDNYAQIVLSSEFIRNSISELSKVLYNIGNYELYSDES